VADVKMFKEFVIPDCLEVARTIADLACSGKILSDHIFEAI